MTHSVMQMAHNIKTLKISDQDDNAQVIFMYQCGPAPTFSWPHRENICWVPTENVLSVIDIFAPLQLGITPSVVTLLIKLQKNLTRCRHKLTKLVVS